MGDMRLRARSALALRTTRPILAEILGRAGWRDFGACLWDRTRENRAWPLRCPSPSCSRDASAPTGLEGTLAGNFLSDDLNENGRIVSYDPERYHLDDVISDKASDYAERAAKAEPPFFTTNSPFLMWIGTKAPHQPATPAARDENAYPDLALPEPPGFDEKDVSDKPGWVADNPPLGLEQNRYMKKLHRKRLQSMLAVDDMIGNLVKTLKQSGELNNTYIFFTSDHGFHLGEHRLGAGKWTPYEEERFRTGRGLAEGAGGAALDPRWGRPVPRNGAGVREHRRGRPPGLLRGRAKKGEARGD